MIFWRLQHSANKSKQWWPRLDSNQRPLPCQGSALPTELRDRSKIKTGLYTIHHLVLLKNNNLSTKIPIPTSIIISAKLNTAGKSIT